jgi:hypothetical protein
MGTTTIEERLATAGRKIDRLQARARAGAATVKPRIQRHVDALRQEEASARAAARKAAGDVEGRLAQLKARLELAEHSLAADAAEDRAELAGAVDLELHSWDTFFKGLQANAAKTTGKLRDQAETAIADLRERRSSVAKHVAQVRDASAGAWDRQKQHLAAAREELERKTDELAARLRGGSEHK